MIKIKKNICKSCLKENYIWAPGNCKPCASKGYKKLNKKRNPTGEAELFCEIWKKRPHVCTNCKENLGSEPLAHFFSHIISKKRAPELRLNEANVRLLCFDCHYEADHGTVEKFNARAK